MWRGPVVLLVEGRMEQEWESLLVLEVFGRQSLFLVFGKTQPWVVDSPGDEARQVEIEAGTGQTGGAVCDSAAPVLREQVAWA